MNRPKIVGILNVTPDSFSDGYASVDAALRKFEALIAEEADIIDIGAESTRPGAQPLSPDEEWARLAPLLNVVLPRAGKIPISLDTRHPDTAARALDSGVGIINDVGGLRDARMGALLSQHNGDVIVMHALTIPADPAMCWPADADVFARLITWKNETMARAQLSEIAPERLIFDPGIGFGKTPAQSLAILAQAAALVESGGRWLFGHSRKSFLKRVQDVPPAERDGLTRAYSAMLAAAGVQYLRVHDVAGHKAMLDAIVAV
ncbi:MAG: dihydropteroate synthase [Rickettsiales bacterium]